MIANFKDNEQSWMLLPGRLVFGVIKPASGEEAVQCAQVFHDQSQLVGPRRIPQENPRPAGSLNGVTLNEVHRGGGISQTGERLRFKASVQGAGRIDMVLRSPSSTSVPIRFGLVVYEGLDPQS